MASVLDKWPIIQRTKDLEYFHINQDCYEWVNGAPVEITDKQFRELTKGKEFETLDFGFRDKTGGLG
ncbi:MAG TPA: hypothetical protein VMW45_00645 [Dehalococcoidia bacterium]|nr:hypothetical protein [Dehalococcoidia bacterium]